MADGVPGASFPGVEVQGQLAAGAEQHGRAIRAVFRPFPDAAAGWIAGAGEIQPSVLAIGHQGVRLGAFAAFKRTAPGLRVSMPVLMARPFMRTEEDLVDSVPEEMLNRHPPRFAVLKGLHEDVEGSYGPWRTSIEKLCDHWSEWDGRRELAAQAISG